MVKKVFVRLFLCMLATLCCGVGTAQRSVDLSFDTLFPATSFKKALDACLQIWADLDDLAHTTGQVNHGLEAVVIDAATGRLVYVDYCCNAMKREAPDVLRVDDFVYLVRILEMISIRLNDRAKDTDDDRIVLCKRVLAMVKKKAVMLKDASNL